jgi:serine/threonine-protein kinase HipA
MDKINVLTVKYQGRLVGSMATTPNNLCAFEYSKEWLAEGFSISPFSLPLREGVFLPKIDPFDGLFGVFSDSLPDGWGRLLLDRLLLKNRINPQQVSNLQRLAIVAASGMGALTYEPGYHFDLADQDFDLDKIAGQCAQILESDTDDNESLDKLFLLGGSSGGARPKILTQFDGQDWIIKFPSSEDEKDIGDQEYRYSLCAKECGIPIMETRLFPSATGMGYFGTRRFDRVMDQNGNKKRIHMVSVSGLLETSHRIPNLDYNNLMRLTLELTRDFSEVEKMYRLMCFNVFAHNRDDHSKNFSFLYDDEAGSWALSPAYDLTYSFSIGGQHATSVDGNGQDPNLADVLRVATIIGLNEARAKAIAQEIKGIVEAHGLG